VIAQRSGGSRRFRDECFEQIVCGKALPVFACRKPESLALSRSPHTIAEWARWYRAEVIERGLFFNEVEIVWPITPVRMIEQPRAFAKIAVGNNIADNHDAGAIGNLKPSLFERPENLPKQIKHGGIASDFPLIRSRQSRFPDFSFRIGPPLWHWPNSPRVFLPNSRLGHYFRKLTLIEGNPIETLKRSLRRLNVRFLSWLELSR
jgi:hypothetical protein